MTQSINRQFLAAEKATLESLLASLREDRVLERVGFESRLSEVTAELAALSAASGQTAEAELVFYGEPVRDHGIDARFTSAVVAAYQDLIAKTVAAKRELHAMGPVPDAHLSRLHITDVIHGSFGFHFREVAAQEPLGPTPLFEATEEAAQMIDAAGRDDEAFVDVVDGMNPRVHEAVRTLLTTIADAGATFRLSTTTMSSEFTAERLHTAVDRVTIERREQVDQPLPGVFLGVLHGSRQFEHKLESGEVVRGKADPALDLATLVDWYLTPCIAHVRVVRWTRGGREFTRFTLQRLQAPTPAR
jgi:hypothetical protein